MLILSSKMANLLALRRLVVLALLILSSTLVQAATVTYDFNITWVTSDPTGTFPRPVIGINGRWPIPTVECSVGDRLIVNVNNQLGNQSTSLHWHGMFQNGTADMDGAAGVTQCSIPPGGSFQYNFTVSRQHLRRLRRSCFPERLTSSTGQPTGHILVPFT